MSKKREKYILSKLRHVAGGSRNERVLAIVRLNLAGYTDEEIADALRAETVRLEEERKRIAFLAKP